MNMLCSSKDLFTRMRRKATEWKRGLLALYVYPQKTYPGDIKNFIRKRQATRQKNDQKILNRHSRKRNVQVVKRDFNFLRYQRNANSTMQYFYTTMIKIKKTNTGGIVKKWVLAHCYCECKIVQHLPDSLAVSYKC